MSWLIINWLLCFYKYWLNSINQAFTQVENDGRAKLVACSFSTLSKTFNLMQTSNTKRSTLEAFRSVQGNLPLLKSSPCHPKMIQKFVLFAFFEFLGDDSCDHFCVLVFILRNICHIYVGCSHLVRTLFECGLSQCYHKWLKACTKILSNQSATCSSQRSQVTVNIQFWAWGLK